MDVYFVDTEGGQATLLMAPSGESMLIDTGSMGNNDRDLSRILAMLKEARVEVLDWAFTAYLPVREKAKARQAKAGETTGRSSFFVLPFSFLPPRKLQCTSLQRTGHDAAIDRQHDAGDVDRLVAGEKQDCPRDRFRADLETDLRTSSRADVVGDPFERD